MGSVNFINEGGVLAVSIEYGHPSQFFGAQEFKKIPDELVKLNRLMMVAVPPEAYIAAQAGQVELKNNLAVAFGSGQRGGTEMFWSPTDKIVDGCRAWVRHQQWQEGGGDGWFGDPIYHDWIVGGAWIQEEGLKAFAEKFFGHPLGAAIYKMMEMPFGFPTFHGVFFPEGTEPQRWQNVTVERKGFQFEAPDSYTVKEYGHQPGVYQAFQIQYGIWEGEVHVFSSEHWQVQVDSEWECPVHYPFLLARNGREERKFALNISEEEFQDRREKVSYSTILPQEKFVPPVESSGSWATFWPSNETWRVFARKHNIRAKHPFLGIHGPRYEEDGEAFFPLNREMAEIAWSEGATKTPPVIGEVPPFESWETFWGRFRVMVAPNQECHAYGRESLYMDNGNGNSGKGVYGWLRVPPTMAVKVPYGTTVREVGDNIRDNHELVVYTDGSVILGNG